VPTQTPLAEQLDALSAALEDPAIDLNAILSVLTDDITAAAPSFLGLILTVHLDGEAITVSTMYCDWARTSLVLPLETAAGVSGCELVLYAGEAGAFTSLAADSHLFSGRYGLVLIDAHLPPPAARLYASDTLAIYDLSQINQAIGVLIESGRTPPRRVPC
jgi:hypothetical protein